MSNFNLTKMAVNMFCPGNVVQLDDAGLPSVLVYIPAFKNSDVLNGGDDSIHPAFIVNGVQIPGFYYSKYQNVVHNGKAYSLPAEDPKTGMTFDNAVDYCKDKGYGWHLSTAAEWAAIALWCKKNGFLPHGNNNYGKDSRETEYKAIPARLYGDNITTIVATGTGPLSWSHNNAPNGIWDLNGNVWEWQSGLRLVWGELQLLANNDAADSDNPQNETSICWKAINAADGSLVEPECSVSDTACKTSGRTVKLDWVVNTGEGPEYVWQFSTGITSASGDARSCPVGKVLFSSELGSATKILLKALALKLDDITDEYDNDDVSFVNGAAERCVLRGGYWITGTTAGVFKTNAINSRDTLNATVGFRAAYIPNI